MAPSDEVPTRLDQTHWAFIAPVRPVVPIIPTKGAHPIDAFIVDRLKKAGLAPSPVADKATLIRRVKLDLVGLPPTPAEVAQFLGDNQPDAYDRLVDGFWHRPILGNGGLGLGSARPDTPIPMATVLMPQGPSGAIGTG